MLIIVILLCLHSKKGLYIILLEIKVLMKIIKCATKWYDSEWKGAEGMHTWVQISQAINTQVNKKKKLNKIVQYSIVFEKVYYVVFGIIWYLSNILAMYWINSLLLIPVL